MRQDEIRDKFANLMIEVCYDIEIEPKPQSLQGKRRLCQQFNHN